MKKKIKDLFDEYGSSDMSFFELEKQVLNLLSNNEHLVCDMDNVEGGGLTKGRNYEILAEKDGLYCIVDDNNNLGVYSEFFFSKEYIDEE